MFSYFYHERIRRSVGAFGALFNEMYILRKKADGSSVDQIRVPLSYAPKRKFLERIKEDEANELNQVEVIALTLPRMSFEITGIQYDALRQLPRTQSISKISSTGKKQRIYTKTPYNIQFQLNVYAKNHDDALQVVEQIMPYFTPTYTLTMKPLDDYTDIKDDIPLTLNSIDFSDDFEGTLEQRRTIIYTLDFEMKIDFYGPIQDGKVIRRADICVFLPDETDSDTSSWALESLIRTEVSPFDVGLDSDYTIVETILKPGDGDST